MKASHYVLSVGLLLAVLLGGVSLLDSDVAAELDVRKEDVATAATLEPATLVRAEPAAQRAAVLRVAAEGGDRIPEVGSIADESERELWALIAQLEELAKAPDSFHELALPVIAELDQVCAEAGTAQDVLEQVVTSEERSELVRGAALLGISTRLRPEDFDATFLNWFGVNAAPTELLRAAAIASALRGERSYCSLPLDLEFLGQLQAAGDTAELPLPRVYPLRIERIPNAVHLDVLGGWVDTAAAEVSAIEPAAIGDFFVTAELVFAIWGHAALQASSVESVVLGEAFKDEEQRASSNLMYLRVANFLVHSLAPCNDRMFDLSVQMAESEDPVVAMLSKAMSEHMAGGIGIALMAKIESVRYSTEVASSATLSSYLIEVGEGLASIADPYQLEQATSYLDAIIQDPIVDGTARAMGLLVLSDHAPWEALFTSAAGALQPGAPAELSAIALTSLVERAGSDHARRARVRVLFEGVMGHASEGGPHSSLAEYIEILSQ